MHGGGRRHAQSGSAFEVIQIVRNLAVTRNRAGQSPPIRMCRRERLELGKIGFARSWIRGVRFGKREEFFRSAHKEGWKGDANQIRDGPVEQIELRRHRYDVRGLLVGVTAGAREQRDPRQRRSLKVGRTRERLRYGGSSERTGVDARVGVRSTKAREVAFGFMNACDELR